MWNFVFVTFLFQPLWNVLFRMLLRWIGSGGEAATKIEVERKFSLAHEKRDHIVHQIELANFSYWCKAELKDWFVPTRDKGELIRIRREQIGNTVMHILTIKNWATTPDGGRERLEKERTIDGSLAFVLLSANHFMHGSEPLSLKKVRTLYRGSIGDRNAVIAIDETKDLGRYSGLYMEVEVMADEGEETRQIENSIQSLVANLSQKAVQVKDSYKELLERSKR